MGDRQCSWTPHTGTQTHLAVRPRTPPLNTDWQNEDAKRYSRIPASAGKSPARARHTATKHSDTHTHRVGGRAAALGRLKPVPTLALVPQNFTQFCKCSWRRRLPVPPQKEKNKTKQNFDSNKTNVDIFAYIPFCNKYLQVSLCEQTPRHNHM